MCENRVNPVNSSRPFLCKTLILKAITPLHKNMVWPRETIEIVGSRGWHSNIFCTPIFVLGQDESPGTTTEIFDGQKSNCFMLDKSQPRIFLRIRILYFISGYNLFCTQPLLFIIIKYRKLRHEPVSPALYLHEYM